jgi:transposase
MLTWQTIVPELRAQAWFATLKMRMGATHFLCKTLPKVATEMALSVLGYNFTRVLNIVGVKALVAAVRA